MKLPSAVLTAALLLSAGSLFASDEGCSDVETALDYWRPIRETAESGAPDPDQLARNLSACLGSPNPELRDQIGYELYTYWLRQEKLTDDTRRWLLGDLQANLDDDAPETALRRSFSALILAEVMRSDAARPFMSDMERNALLESATTALIGENDFRGLTSDLGWVHPVAHQADLLWRFALHPATDPPQAQKIFEAVRAKVAPTTVSYAFNEGDRLARVIATLISADALPPGDVVSWLESFARPASMDSWGDAFRSPAGMAELHNTKQFLRALSDQLAGEETSADIIETLDALVNGFTGLI